MSEARGLKHGPPRARREGLTLPPPSMPPRLVRRCAPVLAGALSVMIAAPARAQVLIGANDVGIGIGDSRALTGIRFNYRDCRLRRVTGVNVTIWTPEEGCMNGRVRGVALGVPATGAIWPVGMSVASIGV